MYSYWLGGCIALYLYDEMNVMHCTMYSVHCTCMSRLMYRNVLTYVKVDVLHKYIEKIGKSCRNYAELSGRTGPNVLDVGK